MTAIDGTLALIGLRVLRGCTIDDARDLATRVAQARDDLPTLSEIEAMPVISDAPRES